MKSKKMYFSVNECNISLSTDFKISHVINSDDVICPHPLKDDDLEWCKDVRLPEMVELGKMMGNIGLLSLEDVKERLQQKVKTFCGLLVGQKFKRYTLSIHQSIHHTLYTYTHMYKYIYFQVYEYIYIYI